MNLLDFGNVTLGPKQKVWVLVMEKKEKEVYDSGWVTMPSCSDTKGSFIIVKQEDFDAQLAEKHGKAALDGLKSWREWYRSLQRGKPEDSHENNNVIDK